LIDALTKAAQGPQGQKLLQYLAIGPIDPQPVDDPKILRGLRGRAASVVTKLIDAASALVAVATLGGADALLFAGLGGALAVLAKHLKLDGRWCNDQARDHPPAEVQGHVAALSQGQGGEHQAPSGHAQGHDHGLSPGHPAGDQHHSKEVDSDDHGQHEGDECDARRCWWGYPTWVGCLSNYLPGQSACVK